MTATATASRPTARISAETAQTRNHALLAFAFLWLSRGSIAITAGAATWQQSFSFDNGATWELDHAT
jgi:hypothetical protein